MNQFKEKNRQERESKLALLVKDCRALANSGKKIDAIRKYRAETGANLAEAQKALGS